MRPGRWSLARQLLVLQAVLLALVIAAAAAAVAWDTRVDNDARAREKVLAVARTLAASPTALGAARSGDPATVLQPYAEQVREDAGVLFVTFMAPDRTRWSHPDPELIGRPFVGNVAPALAGSAFTETYVGTLGRSVRAVAPLLDGEEVVGMVSVGISTDSVGRVLSDRLRAVAIAAVLAFGVAVAGAALVSRRVRRQTRGLGAEEIGRLYEFYDAVLHGVREGLLLTDTDGRVALVNDEARRLLDLPDDVVGRPLWTVPLAPALRDLLQEGTEVSDTLQLTGRRVLLVSQLPALWRGSRLGNVVTMRDHTELQDLTGELGQVRALAESLRSQAHEAANRMHTVVSLVELGRPDDAVAFATAELESARQLTDDVVSAVEEPVLAALVLGKAAQASERGIELVLTPDSAVSPHDVDTGRDLVTVLGNLVDNAIDAAAEAEPGHPQRVTVTLRETADELVLQVADTGPGLSPDNVRDAFRRGWSTRQAQAAHGRGLGLALVEQVVRRRGGTVDVRNDGGAVFTVRLPLTGTAAPPVPSAPGDATLEAPR